MIRRSPRKLPEAAVNAADPTTGVIPYSFACTMGNTQGIIPHGLSEKHFVSYRPAKKRASNHWSDELLQSLHSEASGRDSGLDSAEEEVIRRLFSEKKRETKRKVSRSPKKEAVDIPIKKLKKQSSNDSTSSGDSGRETPTTQDSQEISLKEKLKLYSYILDEYTITWYLLYYTYYRNYDLSLYIESYSAIGYV